MTESDQQPWGRVDETGTVFVRTSDGEREVGQYPDATAEEALAYFERKYADLAGQVTLLEQRVKRGAPATDISKAVTRGVKAAAALKVYRRKYSRRGAHLSPAASKPRPH